MRLFGVRPDQIQVVVHRESIIHSAVEYIDNAVLAQMAVPDMRACIQYALTWPERTAGVVEPLDLFAVGALTFARPDMDTFRCLPMAYHAAEAGGLMPAVLSAANEAAVELFLSGRIRFFRDCVSGTGGSGRLCKSNQDYRGGYIRRRPDCACGGVSHGLEE